MQASTNLDLLRSIAVLLVVQAHYLGYSGQENRHMFSGVVGVTMFFVHTSLVLMFSLERDPNIGHFYIRRFFRIYPLWLAMVAVVVFFRIPQFQPAFHFVMPHAEQLLGNILLIDNLRGGPEIVGAGWTLPLEVQMYLFLPVLYFFVKSVRMVWPLLLLNGFIVFYDFCSFPAVYSALPMCVPYFLPGVMAFVMWRSKWSKTLPAWLFPILLAVMIPIQAYHGGFRSSWLFCLVLGLSLPFFKELTWEPIRVASHYMAKYSYGVYLVHITGLVVYAHTLRNYPFPMRLAALLAIIIGGPILLYHALEAPMIRLGSKLAKKLDGKTTPRVTEQTLNLEPAP